MLRRAATSSLAMVHGQTRRDVDADAHVDVGQLALLSVLLLLAFAATLALATLVLETRGLSSEARPVTETALRG